MSRAFTHCVLWSFTNKFRFVALFFPRVSPFLSLLSPLYPGSIVYFTFCYYLWENIVTSCWMPHSRDERTFVAVTVFWPVPSKKRERGYYWRRICTPPVGCWRSNVVTSLFQARCSRRLIIHGLVIEFFRLKWSVLTASAFVASFGGRHPLHRNFHDVVEKYLR